MKLIFCPICQDVVKLDYDTRYCKCGASYGNYEPDGLRAFVCKVAVPIGIDNHDFINALKNRPQDGMGKDFTAFVIPHQCDTVFTEDD